MPEPPAGDYRKDIVELRDKKTRPICDQFSAKHREIPSSKSNQEPRRTNKIDNLNCLREQAIIQFKEDTDPAGELIVDQALLGQGVQRKFVKIKDDGRYDLFFEVLPLPPGRVIQLRSLLCNEPATAFGDDIEVFVNGISAVGEFPIDQGQFRDLSAFSTTFRGQAVIEFKEDSDPAGELRADESLAGQGVQRQAVKIKDDGRYELFFEIR